MKKILSSIFFLLFGILVFAQDTEYETISNIPYYSESVNQSDEYISERCVLDVYYLKNMRDFPTIVWFYRLHPAVQSPTYIEDAAAAVAWVFHQIDGYGGDTSAIFISGHSAGGYLTMMLGLDKRWLASHKIDADRIAGLIPFSGQTVTHSTIREERGIDSPRPIIDDLAPVYHIRADAPPLLLITGDRELEMSGRYEENAYLMSMMKAVGHQDTKLFELNGYGHSMVEPAVPLLIKEVERILEANKIKP